ncbi:MAG: TRAM domain-containing protein [Eubacteriales bacterium]|nr:TRAM domain-containing protein [Eubacteriales bacterium]
MVPAFVLAELRHIADSGDALRRARGRRGLDVLQKLQKELKNPISIDESDYPDTDEVDVKLLKLCRDHNGVVVTNDYNLNKVAGVSGIRVLNINDLANAVKPMLMAGEDMNVQIVREGKEPGQGVAYLDDGTMIVVENGRRFVGGMATVTVTTVLQTSAGRMIFTKLKSADEKAC